VLTRVQEIALVLAVASGLAVTGTLLYPYSRAAETARNVSAARAWISDEMPKLRRDDRFGRVVLTALSADGGTILCSGVVENEQELDQLRRQVLNGSPPVRMRWDVSTRTQPTSGPSSSM
jgi:hypothetical protein